MNASCNDMFIYFCFEVKLFLLSFLYMICVRVRVCVRVLGGQGRSMIDERDSERERKREREREREREKEREEGNDNG